MPPTEHAILGASSSHRWMECPGSIRLADPLPDDETSIYAAEGTVAHEIGETCLREGEPATAHIGETHEQDGFEIEVDQEMVGAVQEYVDYVRGQGFDPEHEGHFLEHRFNLAPLDPPRPMFGTADCTLWDEESGTLEIIDYKHGRGVTVDAVGNPQLRYYALGAVLELNVKPDLIRMTIVQPRGHHEDGTIRSDEITFEELIQFKKELWQAAEATTDPDAPLNPGDHCQFCKARAICPAQRDLAMEVAKTDFDTYTPPSPDSLTTEEMVKVLAVSSNLQSWLKDVEKHAISLLDRGEEVPGFKLVEGRSNRQWVDEEAADKYLRGKGLKVDERAPRKFVSPYAAEKALKKAGLLDSAQKLEELIEKPQGKPTLAPVDDKRPALPPSAQDDFKEEEVAEGKA